MHVRRILLGTVAALAILALAPTAAFSQWLILDGSVEGDWDSTMFPNQSFDVPLTGYWYVSPINSKQVRIVGAYHYEAEIEWHSWFGWTPPGWLTPYPFEVDASVDLISTLGTQNGNTVLRAPTGKVVEDTWIGAMGFSYTQTRDVRLPDLVLRAGRFGFGGDWDAQHPYVIQHADGDTTFRFGGTFTGP